MLRPSLVAVGLACLLLAGGCHRPERAPVDRSASEAPEAEHETIRWERILVEGEPRGYLETKEASLRDRTWNVWFVRDLDFDERGHFAATGATYRLGPEGDYEELGHQPPVESIRAILDLPDDAEIERAPLEVDLER